MPKTKAALNELYDKIERIYQVEANKDWKHTRQTKLVLGPGALNVEQAIDILAEVLGSREEVLATLSEILVADCDFTDKQRREIYEMIKRLHGDSPYSEN